MRTTRHQCHVTMHSRAPSELWLESNLFVTLPQVFPGYYFAVVSLESVGIRGEKGASGATLRWALLRSRMVVPWL